MELEGSFKKHKREGERVRVGQKAGFFFSFLVVV